jgi:hypothetical protein
MDPTEERNLLDDQHGTTKKGTLIIWKAKNLSGLRKNDIPQNRCLPRMSMEIRGSLGFEHA